MARNHAVVSVHLSLLANRYVFGLGLGNLDLGLEPGGIGNTRQVRPRRDALAHLHRQQLEHAVHPGAHAQLVHLSLLQIIERLELIDLRLLGGELCSLILGIDAQPLLLEFVAGG